MLTPFLTNIVDNDVSHYRSMRLCVTKRNCNSLYFILLEKFSHCKCAIHVCSNLLTLVNYCKLKPAFARIVYNYVHC